MKFFLVWLLVLNSFSIFASDESPEFVTKSISYTCVMEMAGNVETVQFARSFNEVGMNSTVRIVLEDAIGEGGTLNAAKSRALNSCTKIIGPVNTPRLRGNTEVMEGVITHNLSAVRDLYTVNFCKDLIKTTLTKCEKN